MPKVGRHGLDMMTRTCTVGQSRLCVGTGHAAQAAVSLLMQPLATALFANSPFTEGRPTATCPTAHKVDRYRQ
jgi:glutamate--cysteine ligase